MRYLVLASLLLLLLAVIAVTKHRHEKLIASQYKYVCTANQREMGECL